MKLHEELLYVDIPCGVYISNNMYRLWNTGTGLDLPTHILYQIYGDISDPRGSAMPLTDGMALPYITGTRARASIKFIANEVGTYESAAHSVSNVANEGTVTLFGEVIPAGGGIRLLSESRFRFGKVKPDEEALFYSSDKDSRIRPVTEEFIPVDENAIHIYLYRSPDEEVFKVYTINRDPLPFWNPAFAVPEAVADAVDRLDPWDIPLLIATKPIYMATGDLNVHASLSLAEAAHTLEILPSDIIRSWRAIPVNRIEPYSYPFDDPVERTKLHGMTKHEGIRYVVTKLCNKVGWL